MQPSATRRCLPCNEEFEARAADEKDATTDRQSLLSPTTIVEGSRLAISGRGWTCERVVTTSFAVLPSLRVPPARYSDFGEHRTEVHFDGAAGNEHLLGDLRIGEPFDDDLDNAHFSGSKACPPGRRSLAFSASPRDVLHGRPHGECSAFTPVLHERIVYCSQTADGQSAAPTPAEDEPYVTFCNCSVTPLRRRSVLPLCVP
jgi:hypothetical protein